MPRTGLIVAVTLIPEELPKGLDGFSERRVGERAFRLKSHCDPGSNLLQFRLNKPRRKSTGGTPSPPNTRVHASLRNTTPWSAWRKPSLR